MTKKSRDRRVVQRKINRIKRNPNLFEELKKAWKVADDFGFNIKEERINFPIIWA